MSGVIGNSTGGIGVKGQSSTGTGVFGTTDGGTDSSAVFGFANHAGIGVLGTSTTGIGVRAGSDAGTGLEVAGHDGATITASGGVGLRVNGPVEFSQAGKGTVPAGKGSVAVTGLDLTSDSAAVATLNAAAVDTYVRAVRIVPPGRIVVILNQKAPRDLPFSYFVFSHAT
jgi:hypothetical protein